MTTDKPQLVVAGSRAWRGWLEKNHSSSEGIFLVLAKKGTMKPTSLTYAEALEEALCFGWIDGQARSRDDATFTQSFTPRRKRSPWSKRNTGIGERLVAEGRMHATGIAEMDRAKADGRWAAAYLGPATIEVPLELSAALAARPKAKAKFATLNSQNRYAILYRIATAKRAETRAKRITQFVDMLGRGETIYPQKAIGPAASPLRGKR
ncbi:MAG TPA: YdeI/OmpD-associated family protein [Candidatus Micrarchaeaceae archaeon]|nr:YdeI/OmpD-associated family protein [Candidatus Micrarchaeaceae archaeon]